MHSIEGELLRLAASNVVTWGGYARGGALAGVGCDGFDLEGSGTCGRWDDMQGIACEELQGKVK